jgi:3-hydroxyisobutyrate/3-hydroxypropionate dehydrogenase
LAEEENLSDRLIEFFHSTATASNSPIPLGALSHHIYRMMMSKGLGNKDFSVIYDFIKNDSSK